jgi:hypothetical protein
MFKIEKLNNIDQTFDKQLLPNGFIRNKFVDLFYITLMTEFSRLFNYGVIIPTTTIFTNTLKDN